MPHLKRKKKHNGFVDQLSLCGKQYNTSLSRSHLTANNNVVTFVRTEGDEGRRDDNKPQRWRRESQQQGRDSGAERSAAGHLRWRRAEELSGIPLELHPREPQGASGQANCRTDTHSIISNNCCMTIHMNASCTRAPHLPYVLYSWVLHDVAGGVVKCVSQRVRRDDGWCPLVLLRLAVFSSSPVPAESLNARLNLMRSYAHR